MCGNSQRCASESVGLRWLQSNLFSFFRSLSGLLPNLDSSGDPAKFNQSFPRTCPGVHAAALSVAKELWIAGPLICFSTFTALHLLEVGRRRGGRWPQGKASPSRRQWNEFCCTVCACCPHVLHWKRTEGHTRGWGGEMCNSSGTRGPGKQGRCCIGLWIREEKVCPTAIFIPLERYAGKRQVSVSNIRFMSVRAELSPKYFCHGQLWVCYNLLETLQSG